MRTPRFTNLLNWQFKKFSELFPEIFWFSPLLCLTFSWLLRSHWPLQMRSPRQYNSYLTVNKWEHNPKLMMICHPGNIIQMMMAKLMMICRMIILPMFKNSRNIPQSSLQLLHNHSSFEIKVYLRVRSPKLWFNKVQTDQKKNTFPIDLNKFYFRLRS